MHTWLKWTTTSVVDNWQAIRLVELVTIIVKAVNFSWPKREKVPLSRGKKHKTRGLNSSNITEVLYSGFRVKNEQYSFST